jgi:hypothetical protein
MTMQILVLVATVFGTLLALEVREWACATLCGLAIVLQLAALGVV